MDEFELDDEIYTSKKSWKIQRQGRQIPVNATVKVCPFYGDGENKGRFKMCVYAGQQELSSKFFSSLDEAITSGTQMIGAVPDGWVAK